MNKNDWKTKASAIMGSIYGLISLFVGVIMSPDPQWIVGPSAALVLIVGGFAVFGFGDKIQKLINALTKK